MYTDAKWMNGRTDVIIFTWLSFSYLLITFHPVFFELHYRKQLFSQSPLCPLSPHSRTPKCSTVNADYSHPHVFMSSVFTQADYPKYLSKRHSRTILINPGDVCPNCRHPPRSHDSNSVTHSPGKPWIPYFLKVLVTPGCSAGFINPTVLSDLLI